MTNRLASLDVQTALVGALRGNSGITTALGGVTPRFSIFDAVPENFSGDYIVVGEGEEEDASTFGENGMALRIAVEIWTTDNEADTSDSGAVGYKTGLEIADLVTQMLYDTGLSVSGKSVVVIRLDELERRRIPADQSGPAMRAVVPKFLLLVEG